MRIKNRITEENMLDLLTNSLKQFFKKCMEASLENLCIDLGQRAKKVVSDSPGLVDFAIGLVNSVFNLPNGQVLIF